MSLSPERLERMQERMRGTMMELVGFRLVEASKERVLAEIAYRDDLRQPLGLIHAGAILTLADTAATTLASMHTQPSPDEFDPARFPLSIQLNANFVGNSRTGKIVAEAVPLHMGRRVMVVQTLVRSEEGRLFATVTNTLIVP